MTPENNTQHLKRDLIRWMDRNQTQGITDQNIQYKLDRFAPGPHRLAAGIVVFEHTLSNGNIQRLFLAHEKGDPKPFVLELTKDGALAKTAEVNLCADDDCAFLFEGENILAKLPTEELETRLIEALQKLFDDSSNSTNLPQSLSLPSSDIPSQTYLDGQLPPQQPPSSS